MNWFPERGEDARPAKEMCSHCLVRDECRECGIDELHGIWGGTTARARERRRLRVARGELVVGVHRAA